MNNATERLQKCPLMPEASASRNKGKVVAVFIVVVAITRCAVFYLSLIFLSRKRDIGLLWWLSHKESTCQCRRHVFDPWFRKIPHTVEH